MPLKELLVCASSHGRLEIVVSPYKTYRVSAQRMSDKPMNVEFVLIIDTDGTGFESQSSKIYDRIMAAEYHALKNHAGGE